MKGYKLVAGIVIVVLAAMLAYFWFVKDAGATQPDTTYGTCFSLGPQCGTDWGIAEATTRLTEEPIAYYCDYPYEVQNGGNWDQKCHLPHEWNWLLQYGYTEHIAPWGASCNYDYELNGDICERFVSDVVECNTGIIQYDACEIEGTCPTECGLEASEVADGQGGVKVCEATPICPIDDPEDPLVVPVVEHEDEEEEEHGDDVCRTIEAGDVYSVWLEGTNDNDGKVTLRWDNPTDAQLVQIDFTDDLADWKWSITTGNDGSEEIDNLTNGVHYWFRVRGLDLCGDGGKVSEAIDPTP